MQIIESISQHRDLIAEIFQYNNDYCLKGWQDYTHPDIS